MFRRLFVGMRDVARSGSKIGGPQSSSNSASLRGNSFEPLRAHRRSATIDGTCSPMDQSLSYARLSVVDLVRRCDRAYFDESAQAQFIDIASRIRERVLTYAVSNRVTLIS